MNRNQAKGLAMVAIGKLQQSVGRLFRNQRHQSKGFQRQITGKAKIAIGDAQKVIKSCIKQENTP